MPPSPRSIPLASQLGRAAAAILDDSLAFDMLKRDRGSTVV